MGSDPGLGVACCLRREGPSHDLPRCTGGWGGSWAVGWSGETSMGLPSKTCQKTTSHPALPVLSMVVEVGWEVVAAQELRLLPAR